MPFFVTRHLKVKHSRVPRIDHSTYDPHHVGIGQTGTERACQTRNDSESLPAMRILAPLAALSLVLVACERPTGESFQPVPGDSAEDDEGPALDDSGDGDEQDPTGDDGDDGNDDQNDDPEDPVDEMWDAAPPDAPDGTLLYTDVTCGLLDGLHTKTFEKQGDLWIEIDGTGNGPFEELYPCMGRSGDGRGDKYLTWDDEPHIYMNAAGMDHDVWPTETEDYWIGEVNPMEEPSRECVDNLASMGLSFPITMTLRVTGIDFP